MSPPSPVFYIEILTHKMAGWDVEASGKWLDQWGLVSGGSVLVGGSPESEEWLFLNWISPNSTAITEQTEVKGQRDITNPRLHDFLLICIVRRKNYLQKSHDFYRNLNECVKSNFKNMASSKDRWRCTLWIPHNDLCSCTTLILLWINSCSWAE